MIEDDLTLALCDEHHRLLAEIGAARELVRVLEPKAAALRRSIDFRKRCDGNSNGDSPGAAS